MWTPHPVFRDPKQSSIFLWRYIDFTKFIHLLKTKSLFFPTAAVLHDLDLFEGSLPAKEYDYYLRTLKLSEDSIKRGQDRFRAEFCVSCWHYNETESIAMWKLYSQLGNGIAIQTTISDFKASFSETTILVNSGEVIYIDYDTEYFYRGSDDAYPGLNGFVPFIHKRSIYIHEQEYRAIASSQRESDYFDKGLSIPVKLELLIKKVIVAPSTPIWIYELVKSELHIVLPNVIVEHSVYDKEPLA